MDIQVLRRVRFQQIDYVDGLYTAALGNALSDSVANGLIGIGAAKQLNAPVRNSVISGLLTKQQVDGGANYIVGITADKRLLDQDGSELVLTGGQGPVLLSVGNGSATFQE